MIADAACSVETSLDHRLGAYKDSVSKFHGLWMFHDNSRTYLQTMSGCPAHGTKYHAPQLGLKRSFFVSISRIQSKEFERRVGLL
jgi:hypothetical protein